MDLPPPIAYFYPCRHRLLRDAAGNDGKASMSRAAMDEKELIPDGKNVVMRWV